MEINKARLRFVDSNNRTILDKALVGIPLKNSVIIAHSIEFFNDPEPCMIHRSAVMKRLFWEICEYFESCISGRDTRIPWSEVTEPVKDYFDIRDEIESVIVYTK